LSLESIKKEIFNEYLRRKENSKYEFFVPTGKQEEFVNMVFSGKYFISLLSAANGVGKSTLSVNMLANLFFPSGNQFFQQPLMKNFPYLKKGRIVSAPTTIKEAIIPELKRWFPKGRYTTSKEGRGYEYRWKTDTGFEFDLMTFEQSVEEFESANLGWVWIDEICPNAIYKACISRLRNGGVLWITATPLTGSAWMYDDIIANQNNEAGFRTYLEADVWSASVSKGVRGYLTDENINRMIAQYDDEDKQARIFGKFQHLTGLVFKQFSRRVHVIKPFSVSPYQLSVVEAIDPHPRNEDAVLWTAIDKYGRFFVIDELYFKSSGSVKELAFRIKSKASNYNIINRIGDPSMFNEDQHRDKSLATMLKEVEPSLNYAPATKYRANADQAIRDALHYVEVAGQIITPPNLYIFDNCQRLIYEMEHYRWDDWSGKTRDNKNAKEKPIDKDDHEIECAGRSLLLLPKLGHRPPQQQHFSSNRKSNLDPYS
jgi:phage terminase large subunit-like protein